MKLSDVQKRLAAPFPAHLVSWKPQALTKDRTRALLVAYIDARAVMDRLDAICPDEWSFDVEVIPGVKEPTVKGALTMLGVTRCDIGEADSSSEAGTLKAASSDALKRCAVHFGIGRYLYDLPRQWVDWDEKKRQPANMPELPEWARPDHERSPGGAHIAQAMQQLKYDLPEDLDLQREVYRHLKAALSCLHPTRPDAQQRGREPQQPEGDLPAITPSGGISKATKSQIAAHLEGPRWGLGREARLAFTAHLAGRGPIGSSQELTEAEGVRALKEIQACRNPEEKLAEWRGQPVPQAHQGREYVGN